MYYSRYGQRRTRISLPRHHHIISICQSNPTPQLNPMLPAQPIQQPHIQQLLHRPIRLACIKNNLSRIPHNIPHSLRQLPNRQIFPSPDVDQRRPEFPGCACITPEQTFKFLTRQTHQKHAGVSHILTVQKLPHGLAAPPRLQPEANCSPWLHGIFGSGRGSHGWFPGHSCRPVRTGWWA